MRWSSLFVASFDEDGLGGIEEPCASVAESCMAQGGRGDPVSVVIMVARGPMKDNYMS